MFFLHVSYVFPICFPILLQEVTDRTCQIWSTPHAAHAGCSQALPAVNLLCSAVSGLLCGCCTRTGDLLCCTLLCCACSGVGCKRLVGSQGCHSLLHVPPCAVMPGPCCTVVISHGLVSVFGAVPASCMFHTSCSLLHVSPGHFQSWPLA